MGSSIHKLKVNLDQHFFNALPGLIFGALVGNCRVAFESIALQCLVLLYRKNKVVGAMAMLEIMEQCSVANEAIWIMH